MRSRGKLRHVHTEFSHQVACRHVIHSRNALPQRDGFFKRGDAPINLFFDALDSCSQRLPLVQKLPQQEAMVIPHPTLQRQLQLRNLPPQSSLRQFRQPFRVIFARDDRFDHLLSGNSQRIGSHRTELDIGLFQQLLDAIRDPVLRLRQFDAIAR